MAILITGATGCVGQYLTEALLRDTPHDLRLLIRNPAKLPEKVRDDPRVTVHPHDLADPNPDWPDLGGIDTAILVATAWGGDDAQRVIRDSNLALTDALIAAGCRRIFYFSTASVLKTDMTLEPLAQEHGTDYIKGKYDLTVAMESRGAQAEIVSVFPTVVLGGHPEGPKQLSHFGGLLHELRPYMGVIRFLDAEARLHLIHAADIAAICVHLVQAPPQGPGVRRVVLGNPVTTVDDLVRDYAAHIGKRRLRLVRLTQRVARALLKVVPVQLTSWDRHMMNYPDQDYDAAVNPADFGLPVHMPDLRAGLRDVGVPGRR